MNMRLIPNQGEVGAVEAKNVGLQATYAQNSLIWDGVVLWEQPKLDTRGRA